MAGLTEFISPVEAHQRRREKEAQQREKDVLLERAAEQRQADAAAYGSSDAGLEIRKQYQEEFQAALDQWLSAESSDPSFPNLSTRSHERMRMIRELLRRLSPKEQTDGD